MSVDDSRVIDFIGVDKKNGEVILTISDHLDWSDSVQHQIMLQEKLNKYLAFIESGEILESYPDAQNRPVAIKVVFKYRPDAEGLQFLLRAKEVVHSAGIRLQYEVFNESHDN